MLPQLRISLNQLAIVIVLLSTIVCPNADGLNWNNSKTSTSINNIYQSYLTNESYFVKFSPPRCEEATSSKNIALAVFSAIVMLLGISGNLVVILVIQYSQLRKHPGYVLVKSLAVADLGVSFFVTTLKVHMYRQNGNFCSGLGLCVFNQVTDALFPTASITHLLLICINKFFAVQSPYKFRSLVTHQREILLVLTSWFYCLLWTAAGLFTWNPIPSFSLMVLSDGIDRVCFNINAHFHITSAIWLFIVPVIVAGALYTILFMIVVEKLQSTPGMIEKDETTQVKNALQENTVRQSIGSKKGARTLMMVFAVWVICWMPHFIVILINYANPLVIYLFTQNHEWLSEFIRTVVSDILPCINSCINPFIYFTTSSIFRHSLKDSYFKLMKKPRHRAGSNFLKFEKSLKSRSLNSVLKPGEVTTYV